MATRKWPATPAEKRDRARVIKVVKRVGEMLLRFTVYDLRREADRDPKLQLEDSSRLSRHVHDLDDDFVVSIGKRLGSAGSNGRSRHQFTLTWRLPELQDTPPELDDLERVWHALHVAVAVTGEDEVPTKAVTSVLRNVEDLALQKPRNTANHLTTLYDRPHPRVQRRKKPGVRWVQWSPVGPEPDHPHFDRWVWEFRRAEGADLPPVFTGHATLNAIVHEMVVLTLENSTSSTWPAGHPVQVSDIRALGGTNARARELLRFIREREKTVGDILGDLTKEMIAGRSRVERPVVKVGSVNGTGTYYDAPAHPGYERRQLFLPYQQLRDELADARLHELGREYKQAETLLKRTSSPFVSTIAHCRRVLFHRQLEPARRLVEHLEDNTELLSETTRNVVARLSAKLVAFEEQYADKADVGEAARQAVEDLGLDLEQLLNAPRPLLTPHEYASFFPSAHLRGHTPAEFLALVTTLRRFDNPQFTKQTDEDPVRAARYSVDRVEALSYAAERYGSKMFSFIHAGARLLGRDFRDSRILHVLLKEGTSREQRAATAALALLGRHRLVIRWNTLTSTDDLERVIYGSLLMQRVDAPEVRNAGKTLLTVRARDLATEAVLASRTGRWLMQR